MAATPTAFVSGCFDLLHSGHVEFLRQAAEFGRLLVAVGSDATIYGLKGLYPLCREEERLFLVQSLRCVDRAFLSSGQGLLDFEPELRNLRPSVFVVNTDGDASAKRELCRSLGIEYRVLNRVLGRGLPARSTTGLRSNCKLPYRIDLAGGWLDQPFVSKLCPGPMIVLGLEPSAVFSGRSGLATSTRATAERLWGVQLPHGDREELARILFACENPPGTTEVSGSQDAIGIVLPGVNRLDYAGEYWPRHIESVVDPATLAWLEGRLYLQWLGERPAQFHVLGETYISEQRAARLAAAAYRAWEAILARDTRALGKAVTDSFLAQREMFPRMVPALVEQAIERLPEGVHGVKLAGAGGGGYLIGVADTQPPGFDPIRVRYSDEAP